MDYSFESFEKTLKKVGINPVSNCPSCPRKSDHYCFANQSSCDLGNLNKCEQIYKFMLNGAFYYITVRFYGVNRKGFIRTEEANIKNLISKEQETFKDLLSH